MKLQIKRYFDDSYKTYDSNADIQKIVAQELSDFITPTKCDNLLELGIGSGVFTTFLLEKINARSYFGLDLAYKMLISSKNKFKDFHLINGDIDNLPLKIEHFDIIASSSTLQWLEYPEKTINDLLNNLKKGAKCYFSIFLDGTFNEMKEVSKITKFGSIYSLKNAEFYKNIFNRKDIYINFYEKKYVLFYNSVIDFLKTHKKTGARYTEKKAIAGKQSFLNFCRLYEELYKTEDSKIPVTYNILYIICEKR
ncbi:methyltransferase domain-containing protein [Deferribacter thermophilus]|uniref:methyltransferase domain-containing protein n=1 Tax=Deferribacter thermophilus TaxID=53573 RepID=UPI003C174B70